MHGLTRAARARFASRSRSQRGAVALMIALSLTALLIASAMVLDFGLVRIDRQVNKSGADAATTAGLYGLIGGDGNAHPYTGICSAISFLAKNDERFSAVTGTSGVWADGTGAAQSADCASTLWKNKVCVPGSTSSWATYLWTGTYQGQALKVDIRSGYALSGSGFPEENLPEVAADNADTAQGCDQLAVLITQSRKPGLGSLATSSDLISTVRTVGRIHTGPGGDAPAMLLLKRTGCPILNTGSNGGGSFIHVYGAVSSSGTATAGTIHADTDGTSCGSSIFQGRASNGIVAYAAPQPLNPTLPDPAKPGLITSVAGANGVSSGTIRDSLADVYSSSALNEAGAAAAAKNEPTGRSLVTRAPIDNRYLGLGTTPLVGVKGAVTNAQARVFSKTVNNASQAATAGFEVYIKSCSPTAGQLSAVNSTSNVWIDCTANSGYTGTLPIIGKDVVFAGSVQPPNDANGVSLPNAQHVYVFGDPTKNAISLSTGSVFSMHTAGNMSGALCSTAQSGSKAILFTKAGQIKQTGGTLRMCYTTVIAMGNSSTACLPTTAGTAPAQYPCGSSTTGDGQLSQNGGDVDWTAPNQFDQMVDANGDPLPTSAAAWQDVNGMEDLAFWDESGVTSSATYNMNGQGVLHTVGVYMVPNADPFSVGGGATQNLVNAQYIATSISLNGNTTAITMRVDPNAAVTLPKLRLVGLVR